jgi:hypothetical protein
MDELHGKMEVALIFAAFALVAAYAVFEAWMDNERIEAGERIDHIEGWVIRAIVTIFIWGVASFKIGYSAIPCAIGSAFLFSAVFRYSLNGMRGNDWRYMSPSAWYDYGWLMLAGAWEWKQPRWTWGKWQGFMTNVHWSNYDLNGPYLLQVHRAGAIAYITEATITAACVLWVVLK